METFGGRKGILNLASIQSAVGRPYTGYYRTIERKGAAVLESFAQNHGFADGNKRTAILMLTVLVMKSGYKFRFPEGENPNDSLEELVLRIVNHEVAFDQIASWLKAHLAKA